MNARLLRIPTISLLLISLSGCANLGNLFGPGVTPIEINKKAVERTPLNLSAPAPLQPKSPQWILITPQNADQVWAELKSKNVDLVLFGLTDNGYEELSINIAEIRNLIASQRAIIIKYQEYYEPKKEEASK